MVEHVDIPDNERHYPRGADSATDGQVIVSNGDGTADWVNVGSLINPADFTIERLINAQSTAGSQGPSNTDVAYQIEFGPAVGGPSDPVQLLADGTVRFNEAGLYRVKVFFQFGRTSGTGVSIMHLRYLVNGVQDGITLTTKIEDAEALRIFSDSAWLEVEADSDFTYELYRDSTGNNDGLLFQVDPSLAGWDLSPTALVRVERFIQG